ncbi:hypothetical protein P22_3568 [Propionispora sp. 2/2-37]|uniref:stage III sporulation protein AF n=1 Tax=Propionispora sp. 2/2-37 TaxID=1677858 RepID=UPI0006BB8036|nr:stage III sporulation protein AF [Propionispora sp. 2/2-37]CUH97438.1 hypothetical protein P22_3568 [Propionispora sp. 2/2-37]
MINELTLWIKNIILVVLFASFLDLLLPSSSMQRFVKAIVGLFIMLTILNPIVNFFQNKWNPEIAIASTSADTSEVANIDTLMQDVIAEREKISKEFYIKDLSKQVRTLIVAMKGVADAKVSVEIQDNEADSRKGGIKKIIVYVKPGSQSKEVSAIETINKVSIPDKENQRQDSRKENEDTTLDGSLQDKIQDTIANLYFISKEQIEVRKIY